MSSATSVDEVVFHFKKTQNCTLFIILIIKVVGQHQTVYDVYFSQVKFLKFLCFQLKITKKNKKADTTGSGAIGALDAANFLKQSKLKDHILKEIWELSDPTGKGYLDRQAFYYALKLTALAQSSLEVKIENLIQPSSAPKLVFKINKLSNY